MKKLFFVVIGSLFFTTLSNAQTTFGVTGGLNLATLTGDDADEVDFETRTGLNIGFLADIWVDDQFSVQPELKYSMQGAETENNTEVEFDYINLPIKVKYAATENLDLFAGPQAGFLVNAEIDEADVKDEMKGVDFGGIVGAEYVSFSGFGAGLGYNFGLSSIDEDDNSDLKNSVINLNLIYKFAQ